MKEVITFNHISESLDPDEVTKLKALYINYFRLYYCYKQMYKKERRIYLALQMTSISLALIGTTVGSITISPIILGVLNGSSIIIQVFINKSGIADRLNKFFFAMSSYEKILIDLKSFLRGIQYDNIAFLSDIVKIDEIISSNVPQISDKVQSKYNKIYNE